MFLKIQRKKNGDAFKKNLFINSEVMFTDTFKLLFYIDSCLMRATIITLKQTEYNIAVQLVSPSLWDTVLRR